MKEQNIAQPPQEQANPVKLTQAANRMEAQMLAEILNNHGIPSFCKDLGSGGYMNICMGYSIFGCDLYVRESDLEAASALLEELKEEEMDESSEDEIRSSKSSTARKVCVVILGIIAVLVLLIAGF